MIERRSWPDEETTDPLYADDPNFYEVEKRTNDSTKVDHLLYAGNSLEMARDILLTLRITGRASD